MVEFLYSTRLLLGAAGGAVGLESLGPILPFAAIFAVFYFLLIRPQKKQQQRHKDMLVDLKRGDKVVTNGGIYGTIDGITETTLQLKIANQVKIKISRSAIASLQREETSESE